jgi:hypothetical protein
MTWSWLLLYTSLLNGATVALYHLTAALSA